jgi:hypothetical protein
VGQTTNPEGGWTPLSGCRVQPVRSPSECRVQQRDPSRRRWTGPPDTEIPTTRRSRALS